MSKAERKRVKKSGTSSRIEVEGEDDRRREPVQAPAKTPSVGLASLPRGQRSKAKKIKEKYAEQDDEERELALALLGSKATKQAAAAVGVAPSSQEAASPSLASGAEEVARIPPQDIGKTGDVAPEKSEEATQDPEKGTKAHAKRQPRRSQPTEALLPGCERDLAAASDLQLSQLDQLTGQPNNGDDVLFILPMVAPYCSLGGPYNYRIKLVPGNARKGQAAKTALKMFETQLDRPAWKQLLQAVPEHDTASLMCGSCKLSMPGMQKLQQSMKKEKQKEKD